MRSTWAGIPDGLNAGARFRLLFVTNGQRAPDSTNINDYNAFVRSEAAQNPILQSYAEHFRVVSSTADNDARDNIDLQPTATGVPIYWHNGAKLANGYADFWGVTTADDWEGAPKFRDGFNFPNNMNRVAVGTLFHADFRLTPVILTHAIPWS